MKIAVIGANGQLGTDLCKILTPDYLIPLTHKDIEITDIKSVERILKKEKPDTIINTAAYVRVDDCETNVEYAYKVNSLGAKNIALVADELGSKLVHFSTDYVFGGDSNRTQPYTEFDTPYPINVYGKSKLSGEENVKQNCNKYFIVRVSALFGKAGSSGKDGNFVESIIRLARDKNELKIVNDQVFSPTYTLDVANKLLEILKTEDFGIYHVTNKGYCSWYEFAYNIINYAGIRIPLIPISSDQYPQKAGRPKYSVLDNYRLRKLNISGMRPWKEALYDYIKPNGVTA